MPPTEPEALPIVTPDMLQVLPDRDTRPTIAPEIGVTSPAVEPPNADLPDITPDLVERLARRLAEAEGEDPDAQPRPFRFPRWRYHRARARTLLAITPVELRALARVLGVEGSAPEGDLTRFQ